MARSLQRQQGQVWTPMWLAEAMTHYILQGAPKTILDPATGRGVFWQAIHRHADHHVRYHGFDRDPTVLRDPVFQHQSVTVEERDFLLDPPDTTYDGIIANPPYLRHHALSLSTKTHLQDVAIATVGHRIDGRTGYHVYFLLQSLRLLKPNGRLAFVLPADAVEGVAAPSVWKWICATYCLDAVLTFEPGATPFPGVDTNPIVVLIRNGPPCDTFLWGVCISPAPPILAAWMKNPSRLTAETGIEVTQRTISEGLLTGLSRPMSIPQPHYQLGSFAYVRRGIVTGCNAFFHLSVHDAHTHHLPSHILTPAIGRTRDIPGTTCNEQDIHRLVAAGRPTLLLTISTPAPLDEATLAYLGKGEQQGLPSRPVLRTRSPWYKPEHRPIPPLCYAYLGRRNTRFIRNDARVLPLSSFLCIYPFHHAPEAIEAIWLAGNDPRTQHHLRSVGKSYGHAAIKVEPRSLERLSIPDIVVRQYHLDEFEVVAER